MSEYAYLDLMHKVLTHGEPKSDRTGVGTRSLSGQTLSFDMADGFPLLTTKKMAARWIFEELMWFMSGSPYESDLRAKGVDIWKEWATAEQCAKFGRDEGDLGPVYGPLWRSEFGIDQIADLLEQIKVNPQSRRLIVTGWHPKLAKQVTLPPCHTLWQVVIGSRMDLVVYCRSIDLFLGLPYDTASYAFLLNLLAEQTGREPGKLTLQIGDLHIYNNHVEQCKEQLRREPRRLPRLELNLDGIPLESAKLSWGTNARLIGYDPYPAIKAEVAV